MIFLAATTDKLQLTTSAAATIDVNCNYIDANSSTLAASGGGKQNTAISTATTTDILAAPASSTLRTLKQMTARNKHASLACDVTVLFDQNATDFELHKVTLNAGETLEYIEGVGCFTLSPAVPALMYFNQATTSQSLGTSDVYLAGSFIAFPRAPKIGTRYRCTFDTVKTGAGTATPIITVRFGTAGTTGDT